MDSKIPITMTGEGVGADEENKMKVEKEIWEVEEKEAADGGMRLFGRKATDSGRKSSLLVGGLQDSETPITMAGEGHGVEGERKLCSGEVKKEVWEEKEAADGGMWLVAGKTNSGRKSSLLIDVLQDDPENKISILNAEISSSLDHQSVTDKDVKNLDTLMQLSHRIVQEPSYQALYESNSINLLTELGDSQKKFVGSSSIYRASTVDISDASAMSLPTDSAIKNADHESAAAKDIESSDTQMQLAPYGSNNSDILFGLGNSQKKFISSSSLHGVNSFETSDTLSWMHLQISDAIENSDHQFAADKDFQSSDTQMQIARRIGKEPSCQSLYGSNNSDQLIGLGNYKKFVSSSSLHGSSTVDITDAFSSMNLWAGSVTENTDHLLAAEEETQNSDTQMQLTLQIVKEPSHKTLYGSNNCNQLTGCSHYNKKFIGSSSFHGVNTVDTSDALSRRKLQADFMIENADHRPAAADKDILSSDTQMQPALPIVKELPYQAVYRRNNSDQPIELDCYKRKFIGSSSSHGVNAVDISDALSGMNLRADSKIKNNDLQFPADGDIQNSDMPMQLAFQTANKSSYQHGGNSSNQLIGLGDSRKKSISSLSFHGANTIEISDAFSSMNLQADSMIENADFHQSKLQRQIDDCENIMFGSREPKSKFLSTPAILQHTSQFSELNKHKFGVLACSGSSLFRPGEHVEQSKGMTLSAHPYHPVSSMSQAAGSSVSSSQYPHVGNLNLNFPEYQSRYPIDPALQSTIEAFESPAGNTPFTLTEPSYRGNFGFAESSSQSCQEMDLGGAGSPEMSLLRLAVTERLQRRYGKAVAREAQALYDHDDEPPVQLGSAEDFAKVIAIHEACIHALLYPDEHVPIRLMGKSARLENHFAHDAMGIQMSRPGSHSANAVALAPGPGVLRLGDHGLGDPSAFQWSGADFMQIYRSSEPDNENSSSPSFMEVFKNAKNQCFQLIHIKGHVLEFSGDQFGSRFIQQKLPTATLEEKAMVFEELMPHVLPLITDIFGNYVVQKFIEHGTPFHRMILAEKLVGRVLSLSFHMYGCRVIQKALEYNGLDQKIEIAKELDGSILRCIYDQNGNHVIQKCIEHVPEEHIQFIVESIYGNVLNLSAHPYGCRVIQRVLENCNDPATQQMVVSEIVEDACVLSQHQYGNYVVQHVLVHGSPLQRSAIVRKLSGQIVRLSQQKCASNVIEKCLLYGGRGDRQLIINEIFHVSGEIEPLKVMMQDQFANYVIQKVIETCDDWQRELILARIRVHLSTLRNYTYGKHVVSRVEKLITGGERRMMFPRQLPRRF